MLSGQETTAGEGTVSNADPPDWNAAFGVDRGRAGDVRCHRKSGPFKKAAFGAAPRAFSNIRLEPPHRRGQRQKSGCRSILLSHCRRRSLRSTTRAGAFSGDLRQQNRAPGAAVRLPKRTYCVGSQVAADRAMSALSTASDDATCTAIRRRPLQEQRVRRSLPTHSAASNRRGAA